MKHAITISPEFLAKLIYECRKHGKPRTRPRKGRRFKLVVKS